MNRFVRFLAIVTYVTLSLACVLAHAQSTRFSEQAKSECVEQIKGRTAAFVARDWPQLDRLARRYVQSCHSVFGDQNFSNAYEDISIANVRMHRLKDALDAAESCISTFYANPGCHLQKTEALIELGRQAEARDSFRITERLIRHALLENESNLRKANNATDRDQYLSQRKKYQAQLELIEAWKSRYFKD